MPSNSKKKLIPHVFMSIAQHVLRMAVNLDWARKSESQRKNYMSEVLWD